MVGQTCQNLHKYIIYFTLTLLFGLFVPLGIGLQFGKVSPYVPYISDTGATFPEAGIFSSCLVFTTMLNQCIMIFRWLYVFNIISKNQNDTALFLNSAALVLGSISTLAFVLIASFPTSSISNVHNTAAGTASMCIILYMFCQTWISLKLTRSFTSSKIRLFIMILSVISFLSLAIFGILGSTCWQGRHSIRTKTPSDEGFVYYLISAIAEWTLMILFMVFQWTFYPELKESVLYVQLVSGSNVRKPQESSIP